MNKIMEESHRKQRSYLNAYEKKIAKWLARYGANIQTLTDKKHFVMKLENPNDEWVLFGRDHVLILYDYNRNIAGLKIHAEKGRTTMTDECANFSCETYFTEIDEIELAKYNPRAEVGEYAYKDDENPIINFDMERSR